MDERFSTDKNHHPVIGGVTVDTDEVRMLRLVEQDGLLLVPTANYVYHVGDLEWQRGQQALLEVSGDLHITMGDLEKLLADNYWKRMKPYLYASTRPKYICKNTDIDANVTDLDWYIWKYTDANIPQVEGPRNGSVATEIIIDTLDWNI
jgi:hypothetical protein